jgi:protocatechuate 3,4-dioxygenase beta subunit
MNRRNLLLATLTAAAVVPGGTVAALAPTPRQSQGPFYPDRLPLDRDNDLVQVEGREGLARGEVTHLTGRVLDRSGKPISGALVEIWQCDANGRYHHPGDRNSAPEDLAFQGYGQTASSADGGYRFRTIKPVPYPGRTAHIHFKISGTGIPALVTQMYVAGEPGNAGDGVLRRIDATARERVIVELRPASEIEAGALQGQFDIVLDHAS